MRPIPLDQIDNYVKGLANDNLMKAADLTANNQVNIQRPRPNFVDIDSLLDIIYGMFSKEGYIMSETDESIESVDNIGSLSPDIKPFQKFKLVEHHPEHRGESPVKYFPIVQMQVSKRERSQLSQGKAPFSQDGAPLAPRQRGLQRRDLVSGEAETNYVLRFDNELEFIAWSVSSKESRQIAKLIEDFFIFKMERAMTEFSRSFVFSVRGKPIYTDDYGPKRMFGTPVKFIVQTEESMLVQEQTINEISVIPEPI